MFTGIIEELGRVESLETHAAGARMRVACRKVLEDSHTGSSIAVNGVCLTAVDIRDGSFAADLAPETLKRSNLGQLKAGSLVNLERPMSPSGRLSGHIVQGHVDGAGELVSLEPLGAGNWWLKVRAPQELDRYLVFKGSITIDGISLTVADIAAGVMGVTIIPHTFENTNLRTRRAGDLVNLECDIIAKYVEKLVGRLETDSGLSVEKLREEGF
ncbi:MAG: riboflavin synthase [Acidimicrobiia bacterium]|nr:riboflavin synthase [Acidimicrobiia bacterium]